MGEISEAMMDGSLCAECGGFLGEPVGYSRYCHSCHKHMKADSYTQRQMNRRKTLPRRIQDASGRWVKTRRAMNAKEKQADNRKRLERKKRAKARKQAAKESNQVGNSQPTVKEIES